MRALKLMRTVNVRWAIDLHDKVPLSSAAGRELVSMTSTRDKTGD
jgi:hypothetical protein